MTIDDLQDTLRRLTRNHDLDSDTAQVKVELATDDPDLVDVLDVEVREGNIVLKTE